MTEAVFRTDAYARECAATVVSADEASCVARALALASASAVPEALVRQALADALRLLPDSPPRSDPPATPPRARLS